MTTLPITLPEPLREFLERQVAEGGYPTPSDYVQSLLREVQTVMGRSRELWRSAHSQP